MLNVYDAQGQGLARMQSADACASAVWIDLISPTKEEENFVEATLGIDIPTQEEMREIEVSSRLYQENGTHFMTAMLLHLVDTPNPQSTDVTFILTDKRLITVRYADMKPFPMYLARAEKGDARCDSPMQIMLGLLETAIDREAFLIARLQGNMERLGTTIFGMKGGSGSRTRRFEVAMKQIGSEGEVAAKIRESLHQVSRLLTYLGNVAVQRNDDEATKARIASEARDVLSLTDQLSFLQSRIMFMLDASLGLVSIEQNQIIKLFSVAAVMLMPPTLVASIYGMNFKHMPELEWAYGYPMAVGLMLLSAVIPFLYFRRKGWL
jgi:magnesium transporter